MKQKLRLMLLASIIVSLLVFVGTQLNKMCVSKGVGDGVSPFPSAFTIKANIYYLNSSSKLENEEKTLIITSNKIVEALFDALKSNPTLNYSYPLLEDSVQILSYKIDDKKLYLNLSDDILTSAYWGKGYHNEIIYAIVNTMTQFKTIERVQVLIAGNNITTYVEDNINYNSLVYNESFNQRPKVDPKEVLSQFLNYIESGDFESAYALTTANKYDMPQKFVDEMTDYVNETQRLSIGDMLSLDEDGYINISVSYEIYDTEEEKFQIVKVKYWQAYENASKYYIYWQDAPK